MSLRSTTILYNGRAAADCLRQTATVGREQVRRMVVKNISNGTVKKETSISDSVAAEPGMGTNSMFKERTGVMKADSQTRRLASAVILIVALLVNSASAQEAPQWIGAFFVKGKVGLKWKPVASATAYKIYRAGTDGAFQEIATEEKTHYFDTEIKSGTVYNYKIAAVDASGAETESVEKSVTIPGTAGGDFISPTWVGLRIDRTTIFLNWDKVPGGIAYNIYRSTEAGGTHEIIGNVTTSKYADKQDLVAGETYYYTITALNDEFEETKPSKVMSIKFGMSLEEQEALEAEQNKIELEEVSLEKLWEVTTADSKLNQPGDIFLNSAGDIYVTDVLNMRVVCFDSNGKFKFEFGEKTGPGEESAPPDGTFSFPFTLFIDGSDNVYVTDVKNHDIQVFSANGDFIRRIKPEQEDGKAEFRPNGIHVLSDGRIVATDAGNHRFVILDKNGALLKSVGTRGDKDGEFNFPDELTVSSDNKVYVVDGINCRVQEFDLDGNFIKTFGTVGQSAGTFARPKAITTSPDGRIWVSDAMSNLVQGFNPDGEVKVALGLEETSRFITPRGIFVRNGIFYVVNRAVSKVAAYRIG